MSLAKSYSKELIKQLDQIPVYLPGREIEVGAIITFGKGLKKSPYGKFTQYSHLNDLGVQFKTKKDPSPQPYKYASKKAVDFNFKPKAGISGVGEGALTISFKKEGAIYLNAVGCQEETITNLQTVAEQLQVHKNLLKWKNYYIVTSVTVATKAMIMQSSSKEASISIEGNVEGLQTGSTLPVDAGINLAFKRGKDFAFIQDWADDVPVFFNLVRFRKKFLGKVNKIDVLKGRQHVLTENLAID